MSATRLVALLVVVIVAAGIGLTVLDGDGGPQPRQPGPSDRAPRPSGRRRSSSSVSTPRRSWTTSLGVATSVDGRAARPKPTSSASTPSKPTLRRPSARQLLPCHPARLPRRASDRRLGRHRSLGREPGDRERAVPGRRGMACSGGRPGARRTANGESQRSATPTRRRPTLRRRASGPSRGSSRSTALRRSAVHRVRGRRRASHACGAGRLRRRCFLTSRSSATTRNPRSRRTTTTRCTAAAAPRFSARWARFPTRPAGSCPRGADAVMGGIVGWAAGGAAWLVKSVAGQIDRSTRPALGSAWFSRQYAGMRELAVVAGRCCSCSRRSSRRSSARTSPCSLRACLVALPLALLLTFAAVTLVELGLAAHGRADGRGAPAGAAATSRSRSPTSRRSSRRRPSTANPLPGLVLFLGALLTAVLALVVWIELVLREAAIYVAVAFLPIALAAVVWPRTAHWARRLAEWLAGDRARQVHDRRLVRDRRLDARPGARRQRRAQRAARRLRRAAHRRAQPVGAAAADPVRRAGRGEPPPRPGRRRR